MRKFAVLATTLVCLAIPAAASADPAAPINPSFTKNTASWAPWNSSLTRSEAGCDTDLGCAYWYGLRRGSYVTEGFQYMFFGGTTYALTFYYRANGYGTVNYRFGQGTFGSGTFAVAPGANRVTVLWTTPWTYLNAVSFMLTVLATGPSSPALSTIVIDTLSLAPVLSGSSNPAQATTD